MVYTHVVKYEKTFKTDKVFQHCMLGETQHGLMKDMPFHSGERKRLSITLKLASVTATDLMLPSGGSHQTNIFPYCLHIQQLNGWDEHHRCKTLFQQQA